MTGNDYRLLWWNDVWILPKNFACLYLSFQHRNIKICIISESWCFAYFLRPLWQKQEPNFRSLFFWHNMFQSSDPDHMLNKTTIIPLISTLLWKRKSIELAKLGTESSAQYLEKTIAPPGQNPSPPSPPAPPRWEVLLLDLVLAQQLTCCWWCWRWPRSGGTSILVTREAES